MQNVGVYARRSERKVNMKLNKIKLVILAAAMAVNTLGVTAIAAEPVEETT